MKNKGEKRVKRKKEKIKQKSVCGWGDAIKKN
jgi:hypothetical protein